MYCPNPAADKRAARLIRWLLCACLVAPLLCSCASTSKRAMKREHATPTCLITVK